MQFGDKIRELRQQKNLTQPELAEQLSVEQSWLSKIENNKCLPSSDFLQQSLDVFGLSLNELIAGLDKSYVENQLSALPEIKNLLNEHSTQNYTSRRRWLITSATASVIGIVCLYAAFSNLIYPDAQLRYVSNGIVHTGEPWDLYENPERIFEQLGLFNVPEELSSYYSRADGTQMIGTLHALYTEKRGEFTQEILARRSFRELISSYDLGEYLVRAATVSDGAIDIYGNAASEGQRIYELHGRLYPNPLNSRLWIAGCLLLLGGLCGFFVDFRLSRLKQ